MVGSPALWSKIPMPVVEIPTPVAAVYREHLQGQVQYLAGGGGYSGARFWKAVSAAGAFCLRRWPKEHPTLQRLAFQHAVLGHAAQRITFVPLPVRLVQGETWIYATGHLWELSPWLPGVADFFPQQQPEKLNAAMIALAQFHEATADFLPASAGPSPVAGQRLNVLDQAVRELPAFDSALAQLPPTEELGAAAREILTGFRSLHAKLRPDLVRAAGIETPLQPAIRDVHADHILFSENQVTGIIDFGALNTDSTAVDVARLLGSLAGDDAQARIIGLTAYQTVAPLTPQQLELIRTLDRASVLLSGMNWLRWILLEGRRFDDFCRVLSRIRVTQSRLRHLIRTEA